MKLFLDANILVTVVNKELPRFTECAQVLSLADRSGYRIYTSPLAFGITWYFAGKKSGIVVARKKMEFLASKIRFVTVTDDTVRKCLRNKKVKDLEDGLQYYAAEEAGCSRIITYDLHDFQFGSIEIRTPRDLLNEILQ